VKAATLLHRLERLKTTYGDGTAARKLALLRALEAGSLSTARDVGRLHEVLCFLRAYPDDEGVLALVGRMLGRFHARADLRRHRAALRDTGIAGTEIRFPFFLFTAEWLARRWGDRMTVDWGGFSQKGRLERLLPLFALYAETPALDEYALPVRAWVARMKARGETDAAFLIRRFRAVFPDPFVREAIFEGIDVPIRLAPGPDTPSRTLAKHRGAGISFQRGPLLRARPAIESELRRAPLAVRPVSPREAGRIIDLARGAMVTRSRDLDVFAHGDARDVRIVDWEGGLQFALIGAVPERRLLLEAVYGMLTLKNGVPVGYVLVSALFSSSEIAYNVFETFRGAEAAAIYGRVLATVHRVFGSDRFTIFPYQLGHENDEALRSGAWWFYQKVGFRPREPRALRIMREELARMKVDPTHRSSIGTLKALAAENLFYERGRPRADMIGVLPLPGVGLRVVDYVANRFGSDREAAARTCAREAAELLGLRTLARWSAGERLAWERWSPLILVLPGIRRWSPAARRALIDVVRAKGGRRESDYALLFDRHRPLRRAVRKLAEAGDRG
jgi:hypothetical protein